MAIFNSLGSNYSGKFILYAFGFGRSKDTAHLKQLLNARYDANTILLTYKGREALTLVLKHLDLPQNSEVAINGFTCYAVYQAVTAAGFKPVYLDISKDNLNFSAETLEATLENNKKISAVIIQNTLGMPAEITKIKAICARYKVKIVEDLALSIGMKYQNGVEAGKVGDATALSFSQDKVVDAVSGGAVILNTTDETSPSKWAKVSLKQRIDSWFYPVTAKLIRFTYSFGIGVVALYLLKQTRLIHRPMSGDANVPHLLPNWYCRLASKSLSGLEESINHRQVIAKIYREELPKEIQLKHADESIYLRFPCLVEKRDELNNYLAKSGLHLKAIWYEAPIAPKRFMSRTDYKKGTCPNSEYVAEHIINLPTHVHINKEKAHKIAQKVNEWLRINT